MRHPNHVCTAFTTCQAHGVLSDSYRKLNRVSTKARVFGCVEKLCTTLCVALECIRPSGAAAGLSRAPHSLSRLLLCTTAWIEVQAAESRLHAEHVAGCARRGRRHAIGEAGGVNAGISGPERPAGGSRGTEEGKSGKPDGQPRGGGRGTCRLASLTLEGFSGEHAPSGEVKEGRVWRRASDTARRNWNSGLENLDTEPGCVTQRVRRT